MDVSIIIPTRNRAHLLKKCLGSLRLQSLSSDLFEVLVVDNGSSDNTAEIVNSFSTSLNIVYSYKEEPGLHIGRHEGVRLSCSDILVFIDDDVEVLPGWAETIYKNFNDKEVAMVGGNNYPAFEFSPPEWLNELWQRPVGLGRLIGPLSILDFGEGRFEIDPEFIWGCNFSIRKCCFDKSGGFHPDAFPLDKIRYRGDGETYISDFIRRLGMKVIFDSGASVFHLVSAERMTEGYFQRRYFAQGVSDSYTNIRLNGCEQDSGKIIDSYIKSIKLYFKFVRNVLNSKGIIENEIFKILNKAERAYWKGYRFHTKETSKDQDLLKWVLQDNYYEN